MRRLASWRARWHRYVARLYDRHPYVMVVLVLVSVGRRFVSAVSEYETKITHSELSAKCSVCHRRPRQATQLWCRYCQAEHMRQWEQKLWPFPTPSEGAGGD